MIYILCNVETGDLLQVSEEPIANTGAPLTVKTVDMEVPDVTHYNWDRSSLSFVKKQCRRLTKLEYMNRFTDVELATIYTVAKSSVAIEVWLAKFNSTTPEKDGTAVDLDDPRTIAGIQALEAFGLIGAGRAVEILA